MSAACRAVHVCYGDPSLQDVVQSWLAAHQVETSVFEDSYALTAHLILHSDHLADLAFIGADWIPADEESVVEYISETWPGAIIVIYGHRCDQLGPAGDPRIIRIASRDALERLAAERPEDFVASVRARVQADAGAARAAGEVASGKLAAGAPASDAPPLAGGQNSPGGPVESIHRPVLTPEELSALLDGHQN